MKFLKFDIFYPFEYLKQRQLESIESIQKMDFDEYNKWLMSLKMGYYDQFSKEFDKRGGQGFDFYFQDDFFVNKLAKKLKISVSVFDFITFRGFRLWKDRTIESVIKCVRSPKEINDFKKYIILKKFIALYKPDIVFLREPCQIDNMFWKEYKGKIFIASMIGCNISHPINWLPHHSNTIFTITKEYEVFFNLNSIPAYIFEYGFDETLLDELDLSCRKYDVTFIGLLGSKDQQRKTELMEQVAQSCDFKWWGPKGDYINLFPNLLRTWQGIVAGKQMYQVYASSKIVINDYVHSNGENAVNLRMKEAMGSGALMLTRSATNIDHLQKDRLLISYQSNSECIQQIQFYLLNDSERIEIGKKAQEYILKNYNNSKIINEIFDILIQEYSKQRLTNV